MNSVRTSKSRSPVTIASALAKDLSFIQQALFNSYFCCYYTEDDKDYPKQLHGQEYP